jgi:hypothetical protein
VGWVKAGDSYEVSLREGTVVARSRRGRSPGRPLQKLPKALRDHPEVNRLRQLGEWLDRHTAACVARVDGWMVSSFPLPAGLVAKVWPDPAWQGVLRDLVVVGDGPDEVGFLRDVTDSGELRAVDLDGETVRLSSATVRLPHPVLMPDLDDLREFATELGLTQRIEQLHRSVWPKPERVEKAAVSDFAGTRLASRFAVAKRATTLGFRASTSSASCRVFEAGRVVEAQVSFSQDYYESHSTMGNLYWQYLDGRHLPLSDVGPLAWSEGMRMAAALAGGQPARAEEGAGAA